MAELTKHDMTVNVYFHKMKALADELTIIGQPLLDDELISYILVGPPKEFDALYEVVNNRTTLCLLLAVCVVLFKRMYVLMVLLLGMLF
jgi:hypothetical protein